MQLTTADSDRADLADRGPAGWKRAAARALHPAGDASDRLAIGDDVLAAIAAGLAAVTVPWELGHREVPTERRYERVLSTAAYEAWVIYWPSGGSLDLHDHGGSTGAFSVVSGQLDEATIELGAKVVRSIAAGETAAFAADEVHAIANRGSAVATSVHVYSPPLSTMVYYEHDDGGALVAIAEDAASWNRSS